MRLWHLILQEIRYRKLSFALGVMGVVVAVGCSVGLLVLLREYDRRTEELISIREKETHGAMLRMQDEMRRISLRMGFNMMIVLQGQSLEQIYANEAPIKYMPEEYGDRLARAKVATINHVLPTLQQKIQWEELGRGVLLNGVKGEVYVQSKEQKPLLETVAAGTIVVGSELSRTLALEKGSKLKLMGREFTIAGVQPGRGSRDDVAVWINLKDAQELLNRPGLINSILALECECPGDRLAAIRGEVMRILPDTQVFEFSTLANARAEMRNRAAAVAAAAVQQERRNREDLRAQRETLAKVLLPMVIVGSGLWIAMLMLGNVRQRGAEIGLLRAVGLRSGQILFIFLGKAAAMGVIGAAGGYVAGIAIAGILRERRGGLGWLIRPDLLAISLGGAVLLAGVASWLPAMLAARQDPAVMLREE